MAKWWQYLLNPIGSVATDIAHRIQSVVESNGVKTEHGEGIEKSNPLNPHVNNFGQDVKDFADSVVGFVTGEDQIRLQNELQRDLMEEEYQRNLQSIGDTAAAYEAAGFNRNMLYGGSNGSPVSYSAPQLQAYSGSRKIDSILQKTGKVLSMIPAMYQATAALEGIDQARERTKQSEIKTMSMGMSLLDQGYKLGNSFFRNPFQVDLSDFTVGKRHFNYSDYGKDFRPQSKSYNYYSPNGKNYELFGNQAMYDYADASLKNQFDLLRSIGIKNEMNSTLNNWRGYQYSLDRRFGAAGRIVGMGTQGAGALAKLFTPIKLFGK